MSEEEKLQSIINEIKDIYIYLTQGEPTPDDEITAREKLINQLQDLLSVKSFNVETNIQLFEDTLNKLENWDTLELWFVESELPENIQKIVKITNEASEFQPEEEIEIKESPTVRMHEDLETASYDIDKIVDKVSEQFKGEIDDLKKKIDTLKVELEKKDETLKQASQTKVIKKITPKKEVKLPPPKIKIPVIKKPEHPPQVQAPKRSEVEKPKKPIGMRSIEEVQTKIEEEIERLKTPIVTEELQKKEDETYQKSEKVDDILEKKSSIVDIIEEYESPSQVPEPPKFTEMPEKPKKSPLVPEIIEIEPSDKEKEIPFVIQESKVVNKPPITVKPELIEKPPVIAKPKISSVSIEEIEAESIRSTGTDLFNVFSSVGEKTSEKFPTLDDSFSSLALKEKKKKKKEEEVLGIAKTNTIAFVEFGGSKPDIRVPKESETDVDEELPTDKDSLYQELIALEGKRYSLEKTFKELERSYTTGAVDDFEYKKQSDDLRGRLNGITSKINRIRRVIASL